MKRWLLGLAVVGAIWLAGGGWTAAADLDLRQVCDPYTPLTLIGVDTADDLVLFAMPSRQQEIPGWIVELRAMDGVTRLFPDWRERRRFGGSIAPGPVLVLVRCGSTCLQLMRWQNGDWSEEGDPLSAASSATAYPTRDGDGVPWVVLHRPTDDAGVVLAEAYRLEGAQWVEQGRLPVTAVASPAASPATGATVISGSGLFRAGLRPISWVAGLPGLEGAQRGQLIQRPGDEIAYLAGDGRLYLSLDGGTTWSTNQWLPWGGRGGWQGAGPKWSVDLPLAGAESPLAVAWFDNRDPETPLLHLTERPAGGPWQVVAEVPVGESAADTEIGFNHLLRQADGRWVLVAGCQVRDDGSALLLRVVERDGTSLTTSTLLRPTWLGGS